MYNQLKKKFIKIADLHAAMSVLRWDQQVYMPQGGAEYRAGQLATLSGMAHELSVDDDIGELLVGLNNESTGSLKMRRNIELARKAFEKQRKFSKDFVINRSKVFSRAFNAWQKAKSEKNFALFREHLVSVVDIKREESSILGYTGHPYDPLLDEFEPDATTAEVNVIFEEVKLRIVPLAAEIRRAVPPDNSFLYKHFDKQKQWDFGIKVLNAMGYDFNRGRQDLSAHPFTTTFSPGDVRVTTRIDENDMQNMLFSTIHEGGHALYEQGLPADEYGMPAGRYASLAIHESQSRLWENHVGRGKEFWMHFYPALQHIFPKVLGDILVHEFCRGINKIEPGFIRTEADELHYHIHVMIRFEMEKKLITGELEVKDAREYWNSSYREFLGVEVLDDSMGILQDVHWSYGSMGYFPTYSMGSFYAAQFFARAESDIPDLREKLSAGNMMPLLEWLRSNIHAHGNLYNGRNLCMKVTGSPLSLDPFMSYVSAKYAELYSV